MAASREGAERLIKLYFKQLTQGCGRKDCTNCHCAANRNIETIEPTEAAAVALLLATKGTSKLCKKVESRSDIDDVSADIMTRWVSLFQRVVCKTTISTTLSTKHTSDQLTRYDADGHPEVHPFSNLDVALKWKPGCDDLCVPSIPLTPLVKSPVDPSLPRLLVCHDMMGGYQKDRFVQGHSQLEDYYFYHWVYIEGFIYFSHHFLSIPPSGWTNAAHRNGRLSLGTMITEWNDGATLCAKLLSSKELVRRLAHQMVMMALYYQFDGWLINIENHINSALMENLYTFLSLLTTGMHDAVPWSKVIWYDSVTVDGNLKWQNALNKMNQPFFELCDGIFLNYLWKVPLLQATATLAGHRRGDVYVGVDVFGRNCYGGGGYNTYKALEVIKQASLSVAVFAPGWVYETQPKTYFFHNQDKFWLLLERYCPAGKPHTLPIVSSFSRGCGEMVNVDGVLVHHGHWSNLSAQDLQPCFFSGMLRNSDKCGVYLENCSVDHSIAYYGGCSLKISGKLMTLRSNLPASLRLFRTAIDSAPLLVSYSVLKDKYCSVSHYLQLQCTGNVLLLDPDDHCAGKGDVYGLPVSGELPLPDGWPSPSICRLGAIPSPHCDLLHKIFTGNERSSEEWKTEYFIISSNYFKGPVTTIGIAVMPSWKYNVPESPNFNFHLGELKVLDMKCISPQEKMSYIENVRIADVVMCNEKISLSFTVKWTVINNPLDPITHSNIYATSLLGKSDEIKTHSWNGDCVYMGTAYADCFRLHGIYILSNDLRIHPFGLELKVQSVTSARRKLCVNDSDSITVWFND